MLSKTRSSALRGVDAVAVEVEVHTRGGVPNLAIIGLPDASVREAADRVRSAILNAQYPYPSGRITVGLAPADVRKGGAGLDLAIAVGIVAAEDDTLPRERLADLVLVGELALDGRLRPIRGALAAALAARSVASAIVVPEANAAEAALVPELGVYGAGTLAHVVEWIRGRERLEPHRVDAAALLRAGAPEGPDLADVRGLGHARRALEIAAAGRHNLLFFGPPGSGKSMLAHRMASILPPPSLEEALEATKVHSVAGTLGDRPLLVHRPVRAPHHTISDVALVGGGSPPRPGEISLAHHGVLVLDELPEFRRSVLEVLRQPLEERTITIARASATSTFPADLLVVAAMNPCPCGYLGDRRRACTCSPADRTRYRKRISGPLLDRIDLHVEVPPASFDELTRLAPGESSSAVRERVIEARARQQRRFGSPLRTNATLSARELRVHARLDADGERILRSAIGRLGLSARAYARILKVARSIADLAARERIEATDIAEAVQYRGLDRPETSA